MILISIFTIIVGILYGAFLVESKKHNFQNNKPIVDIILTLLRYFILIFIIFKIVTNISGNSILLLILFVSSYLSTVTLLIYKQ